MDFFTALKVSSSGLSAQRTRVNLASSNLANAETTRGPDGKPYRRLDPVMEPITFDQALGREDAGAIGVKVTEIKEDESEGRRVFMPGHPDADADGIVILPNVNPVHEVVNLLSAQRGYEANTTAVDTVKTMAQRALDIMR